MFSADETDDKEPRLIVRFCPDFQQIGVIPERLGHKKVNSMLFLIGFALVVIVLEVVHEYKLFLFYSFGKEEAEQSWVLQSSI